jgi:hypothetical protein
VYLRGGSRNHKVAGSNGRAEAGRASKRDDSGKEFDILADGEVVSALEVMLK